MKGILFTVIIITLTVLTSSCAGLYAGCGCKAAGKQAVTIEK